MTAVIIFDVSIKNSDVYSAMLNRGYFSSWVTTQNSQIRFLLPENTLWKPDTDLATAKNDIISVISVLNRNSPLNPIILRRCIVLSASPWEGIPGIA